MGCWFSSEPPVNPDQIDLSHFTLLKVVGKGGFGKVNAVQKRDTQELLAMKRLSKFRIIQKEGFINTMWREREVMSKFKSPFLVNLLYSFQDASTVYLIMPFMQGGDLRYYLTTQGRMNEDILRFYAAEILLGLEEVHSLNIVYRDLKPDNLLFDDKGHVRISDFGLCVVVDQRRNFQTDGSAGTTGYQAPEVLMHQKYSFPADIWSYGVTLYEMSQRSRPFHSNDDVLAVDKVEFHSNVSEALKDLIRGLLTKDPSKRLGCKKGVGLEEIKRHPFFLPIDWAQIAGHKIKPPHQPETDRANCLADFELEDQFFGDVKEQELTPEQQKLFKGVEFNVDLKKPLPASANPANALPSNPAVPAPASSASSSVLPAAEPVTPRASNPALHTESRDSKALNEKDITIATPRGKSGASHERKVPDSQSDSSGPIDTHGLSQSVSQKGEPLPTEKTSGDHLPIVGGGSVVV